MRAGKDQIICFKIVPAKQGETFGKLEEEDRRKRVCLILKSEWLVLLVQERRP